MSGACITRNTNNMLMTSENRKMSVNWGSQSFQKRVGVCILKSEKSNKKEQPEQRHVG